MTELSGRSIIGFGRGGDAGKTLQGFNPATAEKLLPIYYSATTIEVHQAAQLASQAFITFGQTSGEVRANLLRRIAENIEALGDTLVERVTQETALPAGRIQSERGRTCNQLRLFADLVEEGSWVDARIDPALPDRQPLPRPDIRSMLRPLGPVAVFCASNFPLAFSVAGGDTASALAAGNPVIVKAHHAHPGAAELVGLCIQAAVRESGLPEGVFSLLYDAGIEVGVNLIKHPLIKAGGFTGSRAGGRTLFDAACMRPEPIPFFAEMSSVNPVFILPRAVRERTEQIAAGLHASVTLGAGQFCTNPGLVLLAYNDDSLSFTRRLTELMAATDEFTMLTPGLRANYATCVASRVGHSQLRTMANVRGELNSGTASAGATLFATDTASFLADPELSAELFGPSTLLVTYTSRDELLEVARKLEGQLTATIHGTDEDLLEHSELLSILETKVGRLVFNAFPTGVEASHAMVHGGPYPATSDGRSTSVGTRAITRFARPVCYQGFPDSALPNELKNKNPLGIWRMVDGQMTRE